MCVFIRAVTFIFSLFVLIRTSTNPDCFPPPISPIFRINDVLLYLRDFIFSPNRLVSELNTLPTAQFLCGTATWMLRSGLLEVVNVVVPSGTERDGELYQVDVNHQFAYLLA
jgi:hypothetical protein